MDIIYRVGTLENGIANNIFSYLGMHPVAKIIEHNIIYKYFFKNYMKNI